MIIGTNLAYDKRQNCWIVLRHIITIFSLSLFIFIWVIMLGFFPAYPNIILAVFFLLKKITNHEILKFSLVFKDLKLMLPLIIVKLLICTT